MKMQALLIFAILLCFLYFYRCKASSCDMIFNSTTGNFTSPGFPSSFLSNKQCSYGINAPTGKTIQISFISFDLGRLGCTYAEMKIYEGSSATGQPVLNKCGTARDAFISRGNRLYITFKATYMTGSGFHIKFAVREGCAMVLESNEGAFTSPGHPLNYPMSISCSYQISGPVGTKISLIFSKFTLESSANCNKDSLTIYEGTDESGTLAARMCGTNTSQFLSHGNDLYLKFSSDGSVTAEGFRIFFIVSKYGCDRLITGSSGNITSPGYPSHYPNNARCTYKINAPKGSIIQLGFTFFHLTGYGDMDRFKIYEGIDESGLLTDSRRWGINYPYLSTGNNLMLVFTTDSFGTANGFSIRFTTVQGCNIQLTSTNGMFTSPLYPHHYANNTVCNYTISLEKGKRIRLYFQKFELENGDSCLHDSLKIYEGRSTNSTLAEVMCGKYDNKNFISASNEIFLVLRTNERTTKSGFLAHYYTTVLSCDRSYSSLSGTIKSPNFPYSYPNNARCTCQIRGKTGSKIQLIFSQLSISKSSGCLSDSLKIYEEARSASSLISTRCGNDTTSIVSSASKLIIVFESDMSRASTGYEIFYQIGPQGCGGVFSGTEGTITSPVISGKYPNNALCTYKLSAPAGKRISLFFSTFSLQYDTACKFDSLRIYEGTSKANGTLKATRCGSDVTSIVSDTSQLFMVFATDQSNAMAGFTIAYITGDSGCNKQIRQSSGSISSPFSPSPYPNNAVCTYLIEVANDYRVELTFHRFMLGSCCSGRECDTVKIYDGRDAKSNLRHTLCGTINNKVTSSSNVMYLEFRSDGSIPNYGFQATFKSIGQGVCMKKRPCRNNGTCIDVTESSYRCNCLPWYTGRNCTVQFQPCYSSPCKNGGQCVNRYASSSAWFECVCKDGFTGKKCQTKFDECEGYVEDNRWQRSIRNKIKADSVDKHCDNSLASGWYRFVSKAGPDMPTTCPSVYSCGTVGAIWANGTFPRKAGEYANMTGCVRNDTGCCSASWNIRVKKCHRKATTFHVYRLTMPPSCYMAYCAGTEMPCPDGWNSPNGFTPGCTNKFPRILSKPTIVPGVRKSYLEFVCNFSSEAKDNTARFEVTWYEGLPFKKINQTDILHGKERVARLRNFDSQMPLFRLGTTIFCRIRSWYASKTYSVSTSPVYESNHYFAGVKIAPEKATYTTTEASKPIKLTVIVTVPIVCRSPKPCKLLVQLDQDNSDVYLSACIIEFQPGKANQTKIIEVVAKRDFVNDGTQRVRIRIRIIRDNNLPDWDNHHGIKDVIIIIIDIHTERCTSSGDPHLISFDKLYFNHYKVGDYVLVNSTCRQFEVHVRTWKCAAVTCNCGVAAREGDDVIVVDMCRDGVPRARFASKRKPAQGTSLTRDKTGKSFLIRFPSGAYIRMDNYRWYGSVYYANLIVQVPSDDFNCTVGLCGTLDRNMHNDMTSKDGKVYTTMGAGFQAPVGFTESWRLPVGHSLFYYKDKDGPCKTAPKKQYCTCRRSSSGKVHANCEHKSIVHRPVYATLEQGWSKLGPSSIKSCNSRKRRAITSDIVLPNYDADFDYVYDPPQLPTISATWPTPTGKTRPQVEAFCRHAIIGSEPGKICSVISGFSYAPYVLQCMEDVQITDNFAFSTSAIRSMQDACEEIFLKNTTYWKADPMSNGTFGPPMEFARAFCPGLCSGHGTCINGTCNCNSNHTSADCSIDGNKGPSLRSIAVGGLCDVRRRKDCQTVGLIGYDFMETNKLSCRAIKIKVSSSGYTITHQKSINKASLISFGEVICQLRNASIKIDGDARVSSGVPIDAYVIDVSHDGFVYSRTRLPYLIYDSKCIECNGTTASCRTRANTCKINGFCFSAGEASLSDKCSKCNPSISQSDFSKDSSCTGKTSNTVVIVVSVSVAVIFAVIVLVAYVVRRKKSQRKITMLSSNIEMKEAKDNVCYNVK